MSIFTRWNEVMNNKNFAENSRIDYPTYNNIIETYKVIKLCMLSFP